MYLKCCGGGKENKSLLFWKIKECNMYLQYIFHTFAILIYSKILSGWKKFYKGRSVTTFIFKSGVQSFSSFLRVVAFSLMMR